MVASLDANPQLRAAPAALATNSEVHGLAADEVRVARGLLQLRVVLRGRIAGGRQPLVRARHDALRDLQQQHARKSIISR